MDGRSPGHSLTVPYASKPRFVERRMTRFLHSPASVRVAASVIVATTATVVVLGGVVMRVIDHEEYANVWVGMWWAMQTVTTVGYGDVTPAARSGRIVAAVVMLQGIAFLTITTAVITSTFIARAQTERLQQMQAEDDAEEAGVEARLDELVQRLDRIETALAKLTAA
jgi:voltage-gated potassium channel Kch